MAERQGDQPRLPNEGGREVGCEKIAMDGLNTEYFKFLDVTEAPLRLSHEKKSHLFLPFFFRCEPGLVCFGIFF